MQTLTEAVFRLSPPGGLFDDTVVRNLFPALSDGARRVLIHRAVASGEVLRLKPRLYCLGEPYRRTHPHPFVVAGLLHSPSHVSLESALSYHELIPEAVYGVTSVTSRRSREHDTPLGHFAFFRVPVRSPRAGVKATRLDRQSWAFVAAPLRAIADLVYLRKRITWKDDGARFLTDSMRIEDADLAEISFDDFAEIHDAFRSRRTREYLRGLRQELSR